MCRIPADTGPAGPTLYCGCGVSCSCPPFYLLLDHVRLSNYTDERNCLSDTGTHAYAHQLTPLELYQLGLPQTRTSQTPHRAEPVSALTRLLDASSTACSGMSASNQGSKHSKNDVSVRANEPEEECGDNKQSSITSISPSELERVRDRDENVYRDRLVHLFLLWTLKESYTKALGLGLGFDFKRIEYDSERDLFRVDKRAANRWEIGIGVLNVSEADTEDKDHEREQERERARDRAKYIISVSRRTRSLQPTTTTITTTTGTTGSKANLNCSLIVSDGREGEELDFPFEKDGEGKEVEVDVESHVEWKPFRTIVFGSYDACSGVDGKCDSKGPIKRRCEDDEDGHENEIENEDRRGGGERIFSSERNGTGLADSDTDADSGRTLFEPTPSLTASAFPNSTPCLPTSTSSLANQGSNVHSDSSASEDRRSRPESKVNNTSGDKTNSASLQPATSLPFHHTHFSAEMVIRLVCGITDDSPLATCSHVFFTNT